jgi:hypothetical protein
VLILRSDGDLTALSDNTLDARVNELVERIQLLSDKALFLEIGANNSPVNIKLREKAFSV